MVSTMAANPKPAGVPTPLPKPTEIGVLNSIAEIGAAPVTVRNSTPPRPIAFLRSLATSSRCEMSLLSVSDAVALSEAEPSSSGAPACSRVSDIQPASCGPGLVPRYGPRSLRTVGGTPPASGTATYGRTQGRGPWPPPGVRRARARWVQIGLEGPA